MIGKLHRAPLRKSVAGNGRAVAVLRKQRLDVALSANVVVEQFSRDLTDVVENIATVDEILIGSGGIGDVKIISARAIVFGEYAVECEGDLRVHIGADRALGPRWVDLARCHVGNIIEKGERDIFGFLVGCAEMYGYGLGYGW